MAYGRKTGGRVAGTPNKSTLAKHHVAAISLTDDLEFELWQKYLNHKSPQIAWEAFKLAKQYKSGMPARAKEDRETGVQITVSYRRDPETPEVQVPAKPLLLAAVTDVA